MGHTLSTMPCELPAAIICIRILVITNTIAFLDNTHKQMKQSAMRAEQLGTFPVFVFIDILKKVGYEKSKLFP